MKPRTTELNLSPRVPISLRTQTFRLCRCLWLVRNGTAQKNQVSLEPGITLIEGLVAIVVVALTVTMITPPIMLATATRIQTRRAEQARAIAQGEVDRVRIIVERGSGVINLLPKNYSGNGKPDDPSNAPAATTIGSTYLSSSNTCTGTRYPADSSVPPIDINTLIPVDIDGDCKSDFLMQVFRSEGFTPAGSATPFAFQMGVRVYANYVQASSGSPSVPLDTKQASLGLGDGGRRDKVAGKQSPLAVLYTTLARNDSGRSLGEICRQSASNVADCSSY